MTPPGQPKLNPGPGWADRVFHVLAHARGTAALAASLFDPRYTAWCEARLGPAGERALGEDADLLSRAVTTHAELARLSLLAWLVSEPARALSLSGRALAEIQDAEVDDARVLRALAGDPVAEILWCAVLLEEPWFRTLPDEPIDTTAAERALGELACAAPLLRQAKLSMLRSLCRRGRVREREIWVGMPIAELGVEPEHVAWQAAHEATVSELSERALALPSPERPSERELEHAAVVMLAERAAEQGLSERHSAWYGHFGQPPSLERETLPDRAARLLDG